LGELAASIVHEVNQPLAGLVTRGYASRAWLASQPPNIKAAIQSVDGMIQDAKRASEIIQRVRSLATKASIQKAPLDINNVISEAVALVRLELTKHRVSLRTELAPDLPVLADRIQLQQVIVNLVMNGIQAMEGVTERPRELTIRSQQDEARQVVVTVEDCGAGISSEDANRLFNTFFRTKPGGLGMGLSVCRSIIEAHGGQISASNNAGPGATFRFTLPLHQGEMAA
jgi:signal transduction histidine kinase